MPGGIEERGPIFLGQEVSIPFPKPVLFSSLKVTSELTEPGPIPERVRTGDIDVGSEL